MRIKRKEWPARLLASRRSGPARQAKLFPALLSFFIVGLGQTIKGETEKGVKFMLLFYFALPAVVYLALFISGALFLIVSGIGIIFAVIFWIYNIIDAFSG